MMSGAAGEWLRVVVELVAGAGARAIVGRVCLVDSFEKRKMGNTSDGGGFRRGKHGDGINRAWWDDLVVKTSLR